MRSSVTSCTRCRRCSEFVSSLALSLSLSLARSLERTCCKSSDTAAMTTRQAPTRHASPEAVSPTMKRSHKLRFLSMLGTMALAASLNVSSRLPVYWHFSPFDRRAAMPASFGSFHAALMRVRSASAKPEGRTDTGTLPAYANAIVTRTASSSYGTSNRGSCEAVAVAAVDEEEDEDDDDAAASEPSGALVVTDGEDSDVDELVVVVVVLVLVLVLEEVDVAPPSDMVVTPGAARDAARSLSMSSRSAGMRM